VAGSSAGNRPAQRYYRAPFTIWQKRARAPSLCSTHDPRLAPARPGRLQIYFGGIHPINRGSDFAQA
jgi:hypothetical protein